MTTLPPTTIGALPEALPKWQPATWEDYLEYRDQPTDDRLRLFFHQEYLFVDMGSEGINHALFSNLFPILFFLWFSRTPGQTFRCLKRCLLEKPNLRAASPDLVLYIGENHPQWQDGESRRINLQQWRVPDLVGEVADTTLDSDLDQKKQLYAALQIPEYWVIDIQGQRVLAFRLQDEKYQQCEYSVVLEGLPMLLLEQTFKQLILQGDYVSAGMCFGQQIANL
jgi:Uma2 family endonuclease